MKHEFKGTQGKWEIKIGNYPNGYFLQTVVAEEEAEANAKLIAAAPELLEALQQCVTRINPKSKDTWDLKALLVAKTAIQKALT